MTEDLSLVEIKKERHGTLKDYQVGIIACVLLSSASFSMVINTILSALSLFFTIVVLALIQAIAQLRYFMHLGQEAKPRWETIIFCFMVLLLLIIAIGSLWIMHDLNERVMVGM